MIDWGCCQSEAGGGSSWITDEQLAGAMAGIREVGASRVRFGAYWQQLVGKNNTFAPSSTLDRAMAGALSNGLKPLIVPLPSPKPFGADEEDFGWLMGELATRYCVTGFTYAGVYYPPIPDLWVEPFNEVNNAAFFESIRAGKYVPYLRAAYDAIKAVAPEAKVISAGIQGQPNDGVFTKSPRSWAREFLDSGGGDVCDFFGQHPYSTTPDYKPIFPTIEGNSFQKLLEVRELLDSYGYSGTLILPTEWGFDTHRWTLDQHRDMIAAQWNIFLDLQRQNVIGPWFHYNYLSMKRSKETESTRGLVEKNFAKKPAWFWLKDAGAATTSVSIRTESRLQFELSADLTPGFTAMQQEKFSYKFTGNTKPTSLFTSFGTDYYVSSGKAQHGPPPHVNGTYYGGMFYNFDQASPDHYCEIERSNLNPSTSDRAPMALIRGTGDGDNWVGAAVHSGGSKSAQILMRVDGGAPKVIASGAGALRYSGDRLRFAADGNVYGIWVLDKYADDWELVFGWVDTAGVTAPVAGNLRTGPGFQHTYSAGEWNTTGIQGTWYGYDLRPVAVPLEDIETVSLLPFTTGASLTGPSSKIISATSILPITTGATVSSPFTPFVLENANVTNGVIPAGASGCWVTLGGAGGRGNNGSSGSGNKAGGRGGSGGARIGRSFIPRSALGSTYSVIRGVNSGAASQFSSGSVVLTAGGGNQGSGSGGTASVAGITGIVTASGSAGGVGGAGTGQPGNPGTANTAGAGPGGGGGGGARGSGGLTTYPGGAGGAASGGTPGGLNGAGGKGGASSRNAAAEDGTAGGAYMAGGGGGGAGMSIGIGAPGGPGYTKIEWV